MKLGAAKLVENALCSFTRSKVMAAPQKQFLAGAGSARSTAATSQQLPSHTIFIKHGLLLLGSYCYLPLHTHTLHGPPETCVYIVSSRFYRRRRRRCCLRLSFSISRKPWLCGFLSARARRPLCVAACLQQKGARGECK